MIKKKGKKSSTKIWLWNTMTFTHKLKYVKQNKLKWKFNVKRLNIENKRIFLLFFIFEITKRKSTEFLLIENKNKTIKQFATNIMDQLIDKELRKKENENKKTIKHVNK